METRDLMRIAQTARGEIRTTEMFESNHSHQLRFTGPMGNEFVIKLLTLPHILRHYTASELRLVTDAYVDSHRRLGTPLPCEYGLIEGEDHLYEVASWEGEGFETFLDRVNDDEGYLALVETIRRLTGVFAQDGQPYFGTGIDLRIENFAIRDGAEYGRFIDFHPPLVKLNGCYHVHAPPPVRGSEAEKSDLVRKFTAAGMARRLFFSIIAIKPWWAQRFWHLLHEALPANVFWKIKTELHQLPTLRWDRLSQEDRRIFIESVRSDNRDALREVGALVLPYAATRADDMRRVFHLTLRQDDGGRDCNGEFEARISKLRSLLLEHV